MMAVKYTIDREFFGQLWKFDTYSLRRELLAGNVPGVISVNWLWFNSRLFNCDMWVKNSIARVWIRLWFLLKENI